MGTLIHITRRELAAYFSTPLAYVFLVIFLTADAGMTFFLGNFFDRGQADLTPFFLFQPWLLLALVPAIGMRLWAEERRSGTIEMLMTLPISTWQAVGGKFLAGWIFAGIALALTFPIWLTVNYLGSPDNGVILASYIGSFLMAGAFLAISACMSALTGNQVVAFVLSIAVGFLMMLSGIDSVLGVLRSIAPNFAVEFLGTLSLLGHFSTITSGVLDFRDAFYFISFIVLCLFINAQIVELKRGA
ncbi:MAG TPA: ABC transporter permease subunit [Beijerinckiaceae bacterium]|jgi:ABC-2 type transport system permease protein|nr:ABC transporter permease subunit [Beijerinckiaceae bacterium]